MNRRERARAELAGIQALKGRDELDGYRFND